MVLTALGRAGISFSIDALRDEQDGDARGSWLISCLSGAVNRYIKFGFSVDKLIINIFGSLLILICVVRINNWKLLFGIPAIYIAYMAVVFLCSCCCFEHPGPKGSPLTSVCKVLYTAITSKKKSEQLITDKDDQKPFLDRYLRCLDRALPADPSEDDRERVKIARFVVGLIPVSMTFIFCGVVSSIGNTYFVEQANHMNRRIGSWNVPILALQLAVSCFRISHTTYMLVLFRFKDRIQKCIKMDFSIVGIGMAMTYSILCCITAAKMETRRLRVVRSHDLVDKSDDVLVPMHVAWLLIQFYFLAGLDSCFRKSVKEFYKDRAPEELKEKLKNDEAAKRYLGAAVDFVSGLGFLCGVLSVSVLERLSDWFRYTLNRSRLDRYYWWLAGAGAVNYVLFILVALAYIPKPRQI